MPDNSKAQVLLGRHIAVPESRELNLFATMLEQRGARVYRCPLIAIHDSPNHRLVETWLKDFAANAYDDVIFLTGEGVRRLTGFAERASGTLCADFISALARVRKITRGPKPANALRKMGLKTDISAINPTTEGIIETLTTENLQGRKIAVQLYGSDPNTLLIDFLQSRGASVHVVAPYIYADDAENTTVINLISVLIDGQLDAIAFTSSPQIKRLFLVAKRQQLVPELSVALNGIIVAAVGPVVAKTLENNGITVKIMPESTFFMKPLVRQLEKVLSGSDK